MHECPSSGGVYAEHGSTLETEFFGKHKEIVFVVLPGEHGVAPANFAGKEGHALVLHNGAGQGAEFEGEKIDGFEELRPRDAAIVGGVDGEITARIVVIIKEDKAGALEAVALVGRARE